MLDGRTSTVSPESHPSHNAGGKEKPMADSALLVISVHALCFPTVANLIPAYFVYMMSYSVHN